MKTMKHQNIGVYEAKTRFSELLTRVEEGQVVTITRRGSPVAKLVPVVKHSTPSQRRKAIQGIRRLAQGNRLQGLKIKDLISFGRQ